MRTSLLLVVALSACTPAVDRSPSSAAPPSSYPPPGAQTARAECNGPWDSGETHPAIPKGEASLGRFWEYLAPATLPPPQQECMPPNAPQTDIPIAQTDFGLDSYVQLTPFEKLAPPSGWAAERPELSSLLLPTIQSIEQSWQRGDGAYERIFSTTHWLGSVRAETLASFDRSARAAGLRLDDVRRLWLAFTLRYVGKGADLKLSRVSRTEMALRLAVTIPGDLRADPAVAAAIARRPLVTRLSQRLTLNGARQRGTRFDFLFVLDKSQRSEDEAASAGLIPAQCPSRRSKGIDPRRCYATSDASALVITNDGRFDVLDEPHDSFD